MSTNSSSFDPEKFYKGFLEERNHFERPKIGNFEIQILLDRMITVFETLMMKLEFAATLPSLMSNSELSEILTSKCMEQISNAFAPFQNSQEYFNGSISSSIGEISYESSNVDFGCELMYNTDCSCSDGSTESYKSKKEYMNVYNAIQILMSHPLIPKLSKEYQYDISNAALNFLRQIKYFMEFIISETKLMPEEKRQKELHIRELAAAIEQTKHEISEMTDTLENQETRHQMELQELSDELDNKLDKWRNIKEEYDESFRKILDDSKYDTAKAFEEYTEKIDRQTSALENMKIRFENEKATHRKIERDLQGKKLKVESQLSSLIMKFDTEISERQIAFEELMSEFEALDNERTQLMNDMEEQFIIYDGIIKEREAIAFEAYREKYEKFVKKRCAKIIQRWWRKILLKRKKKNKKKGKKKTKLK